MFGCLFVILSVCLFACLSVCVSVLYMVPSPPPPQAGTQISGGINDYLDHPSPGAATPGGVRGGVNGSRGKECLKKAHDGKYLFTLKKNIKKFIYLGVRGLLRKRS